MSIKFPKVHIAQSVVNRILNVADGIEAKRAATALVDRAPNIAPPQGEVLDAELGAPQPPVTADDQTADAVALKGLMQ